MTWFKVDDGFWSHPKTMELSAGAVALWVRAGSYCCQHLTDGEILSRVTPILDPSEDRNDHVSELVSAGLWKQTSKGFRFHDWEEYQETSAEVKKRRDQWKQRQRKARESREESRVTHANVTRESLSPVPSRPVPSKSVSRETYLPADWTPTAEHETKAQSLGVDLAREAETFRAHAEAHGRKAVRWNAAFTQWLLKARPTNPTPRTTTAGRRLEEWELRG